MYDGMGCYRVRSAGLRAATQVETDRWEDVEAFARQLLGGRQWTPEQNLQLVLKPVRSAGGQTRPQPFPLHNFSFAVWTIDRRSVR
jgi:hypothetical protein